MLSLPEMKQRTLHKCQMLNRRCQYDLCGKATRGGQECRFSPVFSSTALAEAPSHLYCDLWEAHLQLQSSTRSISCTSKKPHVPLSAMWVMAWNRKTGAQISPL